MQVLWNPEGLISYAEEHTISECAKKYGCSYDSMKSYMLRHSIKHKVAFREGEANAYYKHGETSTRLYRIWSSMKTRCNNPNRAHYKNYGARGIKVCEEWNDFSCFKKWALSNGYSDTLTLDRINNDKGYYPDNCRWITMQEQSNNRRTNHLVTYKGQTKTVVQWSTELGINRYTLFKRLQHNWSVEKALSTPVKGEL